MESSFGTEFKIDLRDSRRNSNVLPSLPSRKLIDHGYLKNLTSKLMVEDTLKTSLDSVVTIAELKNAAKTSKSQYSDGYSELSGARK